VIVEAQLHRLLECAGVGTFRFCASTRRWACEGYPVPFAPAIHGTVTLCDSDVSALVRVDHHTRLFEALTNSTQPNVRVPIRHAGRERWIELRGQRQGDLVVGVCRDVTAEVVRAEQVQRQNHTLWRLATYATEGTLASVLARICVTVAETLDVAQVGVWLLEEDDSTLRCAMQYAHGQTATPDTQLPTADYPMYFDALFANRVISADDAMTHPALVEMQPHCTSFGITSMLDAALRIGGRVIGVLRHAHDGSTRLWTSDEQVFAASAADCVSLVLEGDRRQRAEASQRELQTSLLQAQKMESLGLLAGGIAHDLNNLLTPVLVMSELLGQEDTPDDLPEIIEIIRGSALGARDLVGQLLAFSRKQVLALRDVNLAAELTRFARLLRRTLPATITLEVDAGDTQLVRGDPAQLQQVLLNLAINARDAMPNGGKLRIATRDEGNEVVIEVIDTGVGMSPETQAHIFEPFFTTKALGRGTGLGLSTVYGIVRQHNGKLDVASAIDRGTTFTLRIPRAKLRRITQPVPIINARHDPQGTVLVVEDDPTVLSLVRRVLERHGLNVVTSGDPEEAVRIGTVNADVRVLVTDVMMPKLNGRELYTAIATSRPDLKVIYMSGYSADVLAPHGVLEQGVRLVHKPFLPDELIDAVRDAIGIPQLPVPH
jgi:signal transduction histidine kinase/ActR/RegA family two-component response regulator